ncbi:DNA-binding response regulator [Crossiella cryophila]|uniref:DNA-binding NarL/FixJ family response regulator n=1 Tax=Crossiella cryophila TaxID=43355 RepID=A0A7W7CBC7_9PSEU|nr:response regulator transcription factor [Crossiella cryophila]MBB4677998.1 DNA-binding NarL/FixJ family response regulator [Crossiella cryophila]
MASAELITAVVVDDHPAIVAGVQAWCTLADPPIEVLATGPTPAAAWTDPGARADVVVLDLHLGQTAQPGYGDLTRLVDAGRQVIVYTMRDDAETALSCVDIGAFAYLTKAEGQTHLVAAIRAAANNLPYTPPALAGAIGADTRSSRPRLAPREEDVLIEWFTCESKEMVAQKLGLSARTVNTYIDRVRIKYANVGRAAPTKAALVARAIQDGLVALEDL